MERAAVRFLGIEIGGTKLQVGVGSGDGPPLLALRRREIDRRQGAEEIRRRIVDFARPLIAEFRPQAIGVAFGGPIDAAAGKTLKSHHVAGWEDFPLVEWCQKELGLPTAMGNDADLAGWAEAQFGAGRGHRAVFYMTVGTGIGGALIYENKIYSGAFGIAAEIGHLRPGLDATSPQEDLESVSAGWGIAASGQAAVQTILDYTAQAAPDAQVVQDWRRRWGVPDDSAAAPGLKDLRQAAEDLAVRCQHNLPQLTTKMLGEAAADGNPLALCVLRRAIRTLGWAVAQMITLVAPSAVVVGGGVSLLGEALFFAPLRRETERYVFPPLVGRYVIRPAELGEEVMVHGATLLAKTCFAGHPVADSARSIT